MRRDARLPRRRTAAGIVLVVDFYNALGFALTYRQRRPDPYAVVELDDMAIHLNGIEGFDPATSYASVIITVPQLDQLHHSFKEKLRATFGKVPVKGIPRLLPPRRKAGTATGFSAVDVGGDWLRFYATGASEEEAPRTGLGRVIDVAARQGDARGDEARAVAVLDAGLRRHPHAPAAERDEALAYRAELEDRLVPDTTRQQAAVERLGTAGQRSPSWADGWARHSSAR